MKRNILLSFLCLFAVITSQASPITCRQAADVASAFVTHHSDMKFSAGPLTAAVPYSGIQPYYVFNIGTDGGFVIVSGDDATCQVLGYSYKGHFDAVNLPDNMRAWLDGYAHDISRIQKLNLPARSSDDVNTDSLAAVPALVTAEWDQKAPFNLQCPLSRDGKGHRPTGCVATAMAQVMYYHKWPQGETAQVKGYSYTDNKAYGGDGSVMTIDALEPAVFDWDSMLDKYEYEKYDEKSADAVAGLMKYVGHSVEMMYGVKASAAFSQDIAGALVHTFGYRNSAQHIYRADYATQEEWEKIIYREVYDNRPVIYSGVTVWGSGHQFVCDGYENTYFHINWGWSGQSNGFFKLSVLDPEHQGIGGAGTGSSFSQLQTAVIGVQKPFEDDMLYAGEVFVDNNEEVNLDVSLKNKRKNYTSLQFDIHLPEGISIAHGSDGLPKVSFNQSRSELGDHGVSISNITDGTYRVIIFSPHNSIITGSDGSLVSITVKASESIPEGSYVAEIDNVVTCDKELTTREILGSNFKINVNIPSSIDDTVISRVVRHNIYTLHGTHAGSTTDGLDKGIYIIDGKKVVIR